MITILLLASILPSIYLMKTVYKLDKIEPEPKGMILKVFIFGCLSTIPAGWIEGFLINSVLPYIGFSINTNEYNFVKYFLIVALTEEGVKHFALRKGIWKSPEFNYRFDAVVYSVAATLGFATIENIGYVFSMGLGVAIMRAITSIPGHCIFGIYMGYYFGAAKYFSLRQKRIRQKFYQIMSILIPVILHGFYDFCASSQNTGMTLLFFVYIIVLDLIAVNQIKRFAKNDNVLY